MAHVARSIVAGDELPASVRELVLQRLDSVEQVSVLLLLRADPQRTWTIDEISAELRSTSSAIRKRLDALYAKGVLAPGDAGVRFAPASEEVGEAIDALVQAYRDRPNRIIELIYSKPATSLHAFADAFKLKKEKP